MTDEMLPVRGRSLSTCKCPGCGNTISEGDAVCFVDWSDGAIRGPYCQPCYVGFVDTLHDEDDNVVMQLRFEWWLGD